MAWVFWLSLLYIAYVEIGYLLLLWLIVRLRHPASAAEPPLPADLPTVTVLIAAYNEEKILAAKLENTLALDYPRDRLQILVASDCSSDGTDDLARAYAGQGVDLVRSCPRNGKIVALRASESTIRGEIVLFTDADSMLNPGALKCLVHHFNDPRVGAVSGRETRPQTGAAGKGKGEGLYNRIDTQLKRYEGRIGNQVGVHGGIFAMRRSLLPYVPDHLSHDAIVPLELSLKGLRTLYEPEAVSTEVYDLDAAQDFRRRIRTVLQSIQSYLYVGQAMNPFKTGFYAFQIFSHRFSRWFVLPAMFLALVANLWLSFSGSWFYALLALGQVGLYLLALAGWVFDRLGRRPALLYFPYYFVYIHIPAFWAVLLHLAGRKMTIWRPTQRETTRPAV